MNLTRLLIFSFCAALAFSSCQSSKIAYGNSYYFKQIPKHVAATVDAATVDAATVDAAVVKDADTPGPLYASTDDGSLAATTSDRSQTTSIFEEKHPELTKKAPATRAEKKEVRQQRRAQRKAFKKELKKLVHAQQAQDRDDVRGLIKAGIITGVAGAIMLLVGVLANVAFLTALGGIFLAVGVVLVLYKVL